MLSSVRVRDEGGEVNGTRHSLGLLSPQMFGNWTFGTLVFTVMVITVTLKVSQWCGHTRAMLACLQLSLSSWNPRSILMLGVQAIFFSSYPGPSKCTLPHT